MIWKIYTYMFRNHRSGLLLIKGLPIHLGRVADPEPELPDPDLLIRTAGEQRISNFLLWQVSYAEIHVCDVCWPDFRAEHLQAAFRDYGRRVRKFGKVL